MFKLINIKNNTYYIKSELNIGLYTANGKDCILIDTGYAGPMTDSLLKLLEENNLNVIGIINTHSHIDHIGGNSALQRKYNCKIAAPRIENVFIENPQVAGMYIYPTLPFKSISITRPPASIVDIIIKESANKFTIGGNDFDAISLKGHSPNHMGIITPDNVLFTGDSFLGLKVLEKLKLPFNYDLTEDFKSKKLLLETDYAYYVPSHGVPLRDISETIKSNLDYFHNISQKILSILDKPLSLDQIMGRILKEYDINQELVPYLTAQTCISGFLSYLENTNRLSLIFDDKILKYRAKNK